MAISPPPDAGLALSAVQQTTDATSPAALQALGNPFQWKNLYHHRYGLCTYPPPIPRNPSTTTPSYPNADAFAQTLREEAQRGGGASNALVDAVGRFTNRTRDRLPSLGLGASLLPRPGAHLDHSEPNSSRNSVAEENVLAAFSGGGAMRHALASRTSVLMQRKAHQMLAKKREWEEAKKQNPHCLEASVLAIHQQAWSLLVEDAVLLTSAMEAKDHSDSARTMKQKLMSQLQSLDYSMRLEALGEAPFGKDTDAPCVDGDEPIAEVVRSAVASGSEHPLHRVLQTDDEHRAQLLAEFSPFFALISPPSVVHAMHAQAATKPGFSAVPVPGGAGDCVGLPMFSQFATWEEATARRGEWACVPFHFFLTKDVSFNFAQVIAIAIMLDAIHEHMHIHHSTTAEALAALSEPVGTAVSQTELPQSAAPAQLAKSPAAQNILSPALNATSIADLFVPSSRRAAPASTTVVTSTSKQTPAAVDAASFSVPARGDKAEWYDGRRRFGTGKCSTRFVPNACPLLALETAIEDAVVVFEHAGARNALPMVATLLRVLLDKSMKPQLSQQLFSKTVLLDIFETQSPTRRTSPAPNTDESRMPEPFFLGGADRDEGSSSSSDGSEDGFGELLDVFGDSDDADANEGSGKQPRDSRKNQKVDDKRRSARRNGGIFSEKEYSSTFLLASWFTDSALSLAAKNGFVSNTMMAMSPRTSTNRKGQSNNRKASSVAGNGTPAAAAVDGGGYTKIQATARAPTLSIAEALLKFEHARHSRKLLLRRHVLELRLVQRTKRHLIKAIRSGWAQRQQRLGGPYHQVQRGSVFTVGSSVASGPLSPIGNDLLHSGIAPPLLAAVVPGSATVLSPGAVSFGNESSASANGSNAAAAESAPGVRIVSPSASPPSTKSVTPAGMPLSARDDAMLFAEGRAEMEPLDNPADALMAGCMVAEQEQLSSAKTREAYLRKVIEMERRTLNEDLPRDAVRLGSVLVSLSSYMRLHGSSWCGTLLRPLFELLKDPSVVLYVTEDDLTAPPPPSGRSRRPGDASVSPSSALRDSAPSFQWGKGVLVSADGASQQADDSLSEKMSSLSYSRKPASSSTMMGENSTANSSRGGAGWTFPLEDSYSSQEPSPSHSASARKFMFDPDLASLSCVDLGMAEYLGKMLAKEREICSSIDQVFDLFSTLLANGNATQRVPSGIAALVTQVCATVHCHLLSGVVTTSALRAEGIEPDSLQLVEHFIKSLIGSDAPSATVGSSRQPPLAPRPPVQDGSNAGPTSGTAGPRSSRPSQGSETQLPPVDASASQRRRATTFVLDDAGSTASSASVAAETQPLKAAPPRSSIATQPRSSAAVGTGTSTSAPRGSSGQENISLVSDIRTYRLAKFIIYDLWLLPMVNNAQRYGFIPPHAQDHLLRNADAFARYCKVLLHAPYVQRDIGGLSSVKTPSAGSRNSSGDPQQAPQQDKDDGGVGADGAMVCTTLPPFISGVYNASNGLLVQLFKRPTSAEGQMKDDGISRLDSMHATATQLEKPPQRKSTLQQPSATTTAASAPSDSSMSGRRRSSAARASPSPTVSRRPSASPSSTTNQTPRNGGRRRSQGQSARSLRSTGGIHNPLPPRVTAADYFALQHGQWPDFHELSRSLQTINLTLGAVSWSSTMWMASTDLDALKNIVESTAPVDSGATAAAVMQQFCWNVATDDDRNRVVSEFQPPNDIVVRCTDSLFHLITGQHPATHVLRLPDPSLLDARGATTDVMEQSRLSTSSFSAVPAAQRPSSSSTRSPSGSVAGSVALGSIQRTPPNSAGRHRSSKDAALKEVVAFYLRCLHSTLLHPVIAGMAMDHLSVNHRKLFQTLVKAVADDNGVGSAARDATRLACELYPHLVVGVKDQPIVDINALSVLFASTKSQDSVASTSGSLPSTFMAARRRMQARQLFLTTGVRKLNNVASSPPAGGPVDATLSSPPYRVGSAGSAAQPRVRRSSVQLPSVQDATVDMSPRRTVDDEISRAETNLFAPWWCFMTAALCGKAASVIAECGSAQQAKWDRKSKAHYRRYSIRDSVIDFTSGGGGFRLGEANPGWKRAKKAVVVVTAVSATPRRDQAGKSPPDKVQRRKSTESSASSGSRSRPSPKSTPTPPSTAQATSLFHRRPSGTGIVLAPRRRSSTTSVAIMGDPLQKRCGNSLMQRWREAVTNFVDRNAPTRSEDGDDFETRSTTSRRR